jgi:hypothetical protein
MLPQRPRPRSPTIRGTSCHCVAAPLPLLPPLRRACCLPPPRSFVLASLQDWISFLSGKAVRNRLAFHDELSSLLQAQRHGDGLQYIRQLFALSSKLHKPCLRLRILQQVLGLDTRFSRDVVHGVICLAFDVLEDMSGQPHGTNGSHGRGSRPADVTPSDNDGRSNASGTLDLDGYVSCCAQRSGAMPVIPPILLPGLAALNRELVS